MTNLYPRPQHIRVSFTFRILLSLVLLITGAHELHAQNADSLLETYADKYPQQKVYIHTDKEVYHPGESVWFKGYVVEGLQPAYNSKNFYAELIDATGRVVQRRVYPLIAASAAGNFDLSRKQSEGRYIIRGYTAWMLNFDTAFVFTKTITITGTKALPAENTAPLQSSLRFFPEGGNMVLNTPSIIAFAATENGTTPFDVKGQVIDSKGKVILSFASVHDGMGRFAITPQKGETYTAVWTDKSGKAQKTILPTAQEEGVVLHVQSDEDRRTIRVQRSDNSSLPFVYVVAQFDNKVIYQSQLRFDNGPQVTKTIAVGKMASGIIQFTVFSPEWKPLAERINMVNNQNYLVDISLTPLDINVFKRKKNVLEVAVGDTLFTNMSVAITDASSVAERPHTNIVSSLLLTGDLRGYIHDPAYYFSSSEDSVQDHLDLVMLTHGWRRYLWEDVMQQKTMALRFAYNEKYLSLNAVVSGVSPSRPIAKDEQLAAFVQKKDSSKQFIYLNPSGNNTFASQNFIFFDTVNVYYQFLKNPNLQNKATVAFNNGLYRQPAQVRPPLLPAVNTDSQVIASGRSLMIEAERYNPAFSTEVNQLKTVTVTSTRKKTDRLDAAYTSGFFSSGDAIQFDFTDSSNIIYGDIFNYLQGRVAGLRIDNSDPSEIKLFWRNAPTVLYLNEIPAEPFQLTGLTANDIAYVKVFRPPFFGAAGSGDGGAVAVYTRKGNDIKYTPGEGLPLSAVVGYSSSKEFYSPDYANINTPADQPDFRSTLYWRPYIFLDGVHRKKVKVEFFNNDVSRTYKLVLEGINEWGKLVHIEKFFTGRGER